MFGGIYFSNMDAKGRVSVPVRHRDVLMSVDNSKPDRDEPSPADNSKLVVTVHHQLPCLVLRKQSVWKSLAQQLRQLPNADGDVQWIQRKMLGYATEVSPDINGRIQLSQAHRKYAVLGKCVAFVGIGNKLEIWDDQRLQTEMSRSLDKIPEELTGLSGF